MSRKLAINGGAPTCKTTFPSWPQYGKGDETALLGALNQKGWWRQGGNKVSEFEEVFSEHESAYKIIATTNGTHAIELALLTLGIGEGDEVILPAITFVSTASAVQRVGATPVIADVIFETYNIDPNSVEKLITPKTKAIIAVHMSGQIADLDKLIKLTRKYNIDLIQDAAHAPGAKWNDVGLGGFNSIVTYSFQNAKVLSCGEGGAVSLPTKELYEKAFIIHNCGRVQNDRNYLHTDIGSNYRMNEFSAALLVQQLKKLENQSIIRNKKYSMLKELIGNDLLSFQKEHPQCTFSSIYMVMFCLPQEDFKYRDRFVSALNAEGVLAFRSYRPMYQIDSLYKHPGLIEPREYWSKNCPSSECIGQSGIWLPHHLFLGTNENIHNIAEAIIKVSKGLTKD